MSKTQQRGSAWGIQLVLTLYKFFGYKFIYYFLYPISFFYFLMATNVKYVLKIYYEHLDIKLTNRVYFEHLRVFAICVLDRFIAKVDPKSYDFVYDDIAEVTSILEEGAVLVHSHFGGWAAASNCAFIENRINIVMQEVLFDGIKRIESTLEEDSQEKNPDLNIIDLAEGAIAVSVQIANALLNDEVVAMMADRAANEKSEREISFLGEEANFNKNPFQIAYKANKPILLHFVAFVGIKKYKIEYFRIDIDLSKKEDEAIDEALKIYVSKFEELVKKYPNQWFNFYDFWEKR